MNKTPGLGIFVSVVLTSMFVSVLMSGVGHNQEQPMMQLRQTPELDSIVSWMPWLDSLKLDEKRFCQKLEGEALSALEESVSIQAGWESGESLNKRLETLRTFVKKSCI